MQNRKPFNLERALAGDPVVDNERNEYIKFRKNIDNRILGLRKDGRVDEFDLEGNCIRNVSLFMAPVKKKFFIAVCKHPHFNFNGRHISSHAYPSKDDLLRDGKVYMYDNQTIEDFEIIPIEVEV